MWIANQSYVHKVVVEGKELTHKLTFVTKEEDKKKTNVIKKMNEEMCSCFPREKLD